MLLDAVREDQQPADMVKQADKEQTTASGVSENGFSEAVDVGVLIRAPVLVLNLNYVPVNVCTVRRAIVLVTKGKAELLENHRGELHSVNDIFEAPSIIRLAYMVKRPFLPRKLSKKELFLRDRFTCQYCGKKAPDLTLDHVIPRRQNGAHTWENVVAACSRCNLHKAGRTPIEAKMRLNTVPRVPDPNPYLILQNRVILEEWKLYIPWSIRE
ncbi:MAG: HNH endonuclease [Chloroflexi bacterium]|nr:HNH endonuclease [Chloroflexota bacterium]